ncbi:MAG: sugar nucleotide-binding protein, partial [Pseudomonadota bacterium]
IRQAGIPHFILRTSWIYGTRGRNFLMTMLRLMAERPVLNIVGDQLGAPTWSRQIAEVTALMVSQCLESGCFVPGERSGIYHVSCRGVTSWHGFAEEIERIASAAGIVPEAHATLVAVSSADYPTPAKRPAYSVLCNDKLWDTFNLRLPPWRRALELCLEELAGMRRNGNAGGP